jgi:hypothetical protein
MLAELVRFGGDRSLFFGTTTLRAFGAVITVF